jgi:hypothetical protein
MTESPASTAVQEPSVHGPGVGVSETHISGTVVAEAVAVIDKALAEMLRRELVSAVEVGDLLLDLRSLLTSHS